MNGQQEHDTYHSVAKKYLRDKKKPQMGIVADMIYQITHSNDPAEQAIQGVNLVDICEEWRRNREIIEGLWVMAGGDREKVAHIFDSL